MSKRKADEVLGDIEGSETEEAADKALSMTADERRKALEAADVRVDEVHAQADAWRERAQRGSVEEAREQPEAQARPKVRRPDEGRRRTWFLGAAATIMAVGVALVLRPRGAGDDTPAATPPVRDARTSAPGTGVSEAGGRVGDAGEAGSGRMQEGTGR